MLLYVNVLPPLLLYKIVSLKSPLAPQANPIKKYLENYLYCNPQKRHYQGNPPFELSIEGTFSKFCDFQIKE
jgi:hypothetical protein